MNRLSFLIAAICLLPNVCASESPPQLSFPVDCSLGENCFIQHLVDRDASEGVLDAMCGRLTYDGHKGTDIRLVDRRQMEQGVSVLAAAPGTVRGRRDGVPDRIVETPSQTEGLECGNGVVLTHPDGWETQYCHMKEGSVLPKVGDRIERGEPIGQIGLSGLTQFPHLHLSVRRDGKVIDPFLPDDAAGCTTEARETLWRETPVYKPGTIMRTGFETAVPDLRDVKNHATGLKNLSSTDPALVAWAFGIGKQDGDRLEIILTDPDGQTRTHSENFERTQIVWLYAFGVRRPSEGWVSGTYRSEFLWYRDGDLLERKTDQILGPE